jgi:LysM repeat protein
VTELRLTRRGRLLVLATLVVAALLAITVGQAVVGAFSAEAGSSSSTDAARTWVVEPGETLWSIAQQLDPNTDPRETVARIESMNDLSGSGVLAGQEIFVPGP